MCVWFLVHVRIFPSSYFCSLFVYQLGISSFFLFLPVFLKHHLQHVLIFFFFTHVPFLSLLLPFPFFPLLFFLSFIFNSPLARSVCSTSSACAICTASGRIFSDRVFHARKTTHTIVRSTPAICGWKILTQRRKRNKSEQG